ncbi:hypothetical protein MOTE_23690 [Moorella thermoacetica]|uniref:Anti-sigma-W factor RsiW n=1 Tax=Neomoorella thermoacetica TaxID=1525 RepID=A0A1J5NWB2_NEOTH|nr:hypothetical protein MOTE_23690 [Moorella thermoacetica]
MNCSQCRELISPYLDGVLSETMNRAMENHLHACPACRGELEAMGQVIEIVRAWSEEELDLPSGFGERLRARLEECRQPWYRRLFRNKLSLAAAAAIIMLVAITARADYFNLGSSRETAVPLEKQMQASAATREDRQVTPLLSLPPVTSTGARQQPAPEVKAKTITTPARSSMSNMESFHPEPEQQHRKTVPGRTFNLNSRDRAERSVPDQQATVAARKGQPDQDKDKRKEQRSGSPEQEPGQSRRVLEAGNKEISPGDGVKVAGGELSTATGDGPGTGKAPAGDGNEPPPLPPAGVEAAPRDPPHGDGRQKPAATPDNDLQSRTLTEPPPPPAAQATIPKPPSS